MPSKLTAHKLNGPAKDLVCQMFAEFARPTEGQTAVRETFRVEVSLPSILQCQDSPKWLRSHSEKGDR